jgi:leucyl aminopeptidase
MPVGKGVTYDTGGADVKAGGIMAGMSRDKCGAAAVAGFFQVLALLKPKGVKAIGAMSIVRNSIGENCYVADEIIVSRAGVRTRIGNTDAEGRMVMTDVLCMMKELAVNEVNPHLFTIATLTGHVCLAVGNYTAVMDNGPAKRENFSAKIQKNGEELGDMIEISTIRREDYDFIKKGTGDGEDLLQCNNAASSRTPRGHQFPAAFMIEAAGLDKHGINSKKPLKYTHIDIAGSSGHVPDTPTSVPILALAKTFFGEQL